MASENDSEKDSEKDYTFGNRGSKVTDVSISQTGVKTVVTAPKSARKAGIALDSKTGATFDVDSKGRALQAGGYAH